MLFQQQLEPVVPIIDQMRNYDFANEEPLQNHEIIQTNTFPQDESQTQANHISYLINARSGFLQSLQRLRWEFFDNYFFRCRTIKLFYWKIQKKISLRNDRTCSICLMQINKREQIAKLECRHCYHFVCLEEWQKQNSTCPMCRRQMSNSWQPQIQIFQYEQLKLNILSEKRQKRALIKQKKQERKLGKEKEKNMIKCQQTLKSKSFQPRNRFRFNYKMNFSNRRKN